MNYFVCEGWWWLPETPERRVNGTLTFDDGGAKLEVYEACLSFEEDTWPPRFATHSLVYGTTREQEDITLFSVRGTRFSAPTMPSGQGVATTAAYSIASGARGMHAPNLFRTAYLQFDFLHAWASPPSLVDYSHSPETFSIRRGSQVLAEAQNQGVRVQLDTWIAESWGAKITLEQITELRVDLDEPAPLDELVNRHVSAFSDLLALCLDRPVRLKRLLASPAAVEAQDHPLALFFTGISSTSGGEEASLVDVIGVNASTLLYGGNCPCTIAQLLERWIPLHKELRPVLAPLLSRLYAPFMYAEHELGSTVNAAEAFHKIRFVARQLPSELHKARVDAIVTAARAARVEQSSIEWAQPVLLSANYKPLRELISELLAASGVVGDAILSAEPDFAKHVKMLRSSVAHGNAQTSELPHVQRFWHERALRWVIRVLILGELVGDQFDAAKRAQGMEAFQFVVRSLASH